MKPPRPRACAALALLAALATPLFPTRGAAAALRVTIAFTGDVSGYLEPCG